MTYSDVKGNQYVKTKKKQSRRNRTTRKTKMSRNDEGGPINREDDIKIVDVERTDP